MDLDLSFDVAGDAQRFTPKERAQTTSGLGLSQPPIVVHDHLS